MAHLSIRLVFNYTTIIFLMIWRTVISRTTGRTRAETQEVLQ